MLKQDSIKILEVQTKNKHTNSQNESVICYNGKKACENFNCLAFRCSEL